MADWLIIWGTLVGSGALAAIFHFSYRHRLRAMTQQLQQAKRELRDTAQLPLHDPHPLIQLDEAGSVFFMNPAAQQEFLSLQESDDTSILDEITDGIIPHWKAHKQHLPVQREIRLHDQVFEQTIHRTMSNGRPAYNVYAVDITRRKANERALHAARLQAEAANRARGDFLATMSHELRTPMHGILGLSDLLLDFDLPHKQQELVQTIHESAQDLLTLLNDILDFSKIEAGEINLERIAFQPHTLLQHLVTLYRPMAETKGLTLDFPTPHDLPEQVLGDPTRLKQIIQNLLGNAIKFTQEGSITLHVSGQQEGNHCALSIAVQDTGIGIAKEQQTRVFDKFQQADSTTTRHYGGTGLGLAISRQLALCMQGDITLQSTLGEGTVFTLHLILPIAETEKKTETPAVPEPSNAEPAPHNRKLLLVDDTPANLMVLRLHLGKLGYHGIDLVKSGEQAVEAARHTDYDLIFMDCQMPGMDGFEASRQIRAHAPPHHQPTIIAITADAMKATAERCLEAGMDGHLAKPFSRTQLQTLLANGKNIAYHPCADVIPHPMDWQRVEQMTEGDKHMEQEVMDVFVEDLRHSLSELASHFAQHDQPEWVKLAHRLYGASANMGAQQLAILCHKAQTMHLAPWQDLETCHHTIMQQGNQLLHLLSAKYGAAA